ncbi:CHAP domain-containing protein [Acetobacter ascendens]|uniref:Amidase n=1 Tax=Acetobacter ascendens TaxID=481146 RepID=A0A1D8QTM8_9PROT|nr:CHAP domain-containing protein [Acetobacter ascendens]RCL07175.1 amidase [Acetobacter pasteurianus]GCD74412.1 hypothetical protein NBRC3299_0704 [Acetobacter pasteurianus NBRC 3299]AOW45675.1 amidase [Acetobacter ascendens]AOW50308.1 amidase [Acetobacter ascendens]ARW09577.1 hypothetical protein S101447_00472 [Acetobacter ascendens]
MKRSLVLVLPLLLAACAGGRGSWNGSVQCAPYAREHSAVNLRGAAASWWGEAQGQYGRTSSPRAGDVLVFRSTGRLPSGHVSVVKQVRNSRLVLVDHANWEPGEVTRHAPVVDVSPNNNWTRVRVWWSPIHAMGKTVYPVYGFIEPTGTGGS